MQAGNSARLVGWSFEREGWLPARRAARPRPVTAAVAPGTRILVDRIDEDSVALALHLSALSADVRIVAEPETCPDGALLQQLRAAGIPVAAERAGGIVGAEIVFAHDYTSPVEPFLAEARRAGALVAQFADVVLESPHSPTVAVTGSAGKSTVAELVSRMLRTSQIPVYAPERHYLLDSKNPNRELLGLLPDAPGWQVLELTSSHLEYMHGSPEIAIVTRVHPDHVEWHGSVERYLDAKSVIGAHQQPGDWVVAIADDPGSRAVAARARGRVCLCSTSVACDPGVHIAGGTIVATWDGETVPLVARDEVALPGRQIENALSASAGALLAGASTAAVRSTLRAFRGLQRRVELVAEHGGVRAFNDGMAYTPAKAAASLETFPDGSVVLICGGGEGFAGWSMAPLHSSEAEQQQLAAFAELAARKLRGALVLGARSGLLRELLETAGVPGRAIVEVVDMAAATRGAADLARPGDSILLTPIFAMPEPAIASFDRLIREGLVSGSCSRRR